MSPTKPIRVYVIDDQAILRAALRRLLADECGFEVVGDSGDVRTAEADLAALRPDVVTLDVTASGLTGIDALPRLQKASPESRFLVLAEHEAGHLLEDSLRAGASGYVTKDSEPAELRIAVESVSAGRTYVTSRVPATLVQRKNGARVAEVFEGGTAGRLALLTSREREVFQLLALGRSNKEVASELNVSLGTAKKHRENLQRKLDAHSPAQLARIAIQEGLLSG